MNQKPTAGGLSGSNNPFVGEKMTTDPISGINF
jgi:hypothetical protein